MIYPRFTGLYLMQILKKRGKAGIGLPACLPLCTPASRVSAAAWPWPAALCRHLGLGSFQARHSSLSHAGGGVAFLSLPRPCLHPQPWPVSFLLLAWALCAPGSWSHGSLAAYLFSGAQFHLAHSSWTRRLRNEGLFWTPGSPPSLLCPQLLDLQE